ncbi:serine O-acetyltransferase [Klebsiella pneumoniae]|uniref:serine O-acetyltransferase n=1 Tax=Klebsiella variicola TaxID=244366 RepID=UPI003526D558
MLNHIHTSVIGETTTTGDNVSLLHLVTLGGIGKVGTERYSKIGNDVVIGAGAKVLGNILVGDNSCIAAGPVVLRDTFSLCTVAGVLEKLVEKYNILGNIYMVI